MFWDRIFLVQIWKYVGTVNLPYTIHVVTDIVHSLTIVILTVPHFGI